MGPVDLSHALGLAQRLGFPACFDSAEFQARGWRAWGGGPAAAGLRPHPAVASQARAGRCLQGHCLHGHVRACRSCPASPEPCCHAPAAVGPAWLVQEVVTRVVRLCCEKGVTPGNFALTEQKAQVGGGTWAGTGCRAAGSQRAVRREGAAWGALGGNSPMHRAPATFGFFLSSSPSAGAAGPGVHLPGNGDGRGADGRGGGAQRGVCKQAARLVAARACAHRFGCNPDISGLYALGAGKQLMRVGVAAGDELRHAGGGSAQACGGSPALCLFASGSMSCAAAIAPIAQRWAPAKAPLRGQPARRLSLRPCRRLSPAAAAPEFQPDATPDPAPSSSAPPPPPPAPSKADALPPERLKQLRRDGLAMKDVIKMGRRGPAEGLANQVRQRWNTSEVRRQMWVQPGRAWHG